MYQNELKIMIEASKIAAKKIMEFYNQGFGVETKEDNSPVTDADLAADKIIREILHKEFPNYALLTEESKDDLSRLNNDYLFVVDPIDGTKDFVKKDDMFTINIGLVYRKEVVAGVVFIPAKNEYYFASKNQGAYYVSSNNEKERIHVSNKTNQLIMLTSVFHTTDKEVSIYENNKERISEIRKIGSSIKACHIAHGIGDVSFRMGPGTKEWDTAASQIIVLEAGGIFAKPDLSPIFYNREDVYNREGFVILNRKENLLK